MISQVMRARNVSHYTIPDVAVVDDDARKQVLQRQGTRLDRCHHGLTGMAKSNTTFPPGQKKKDFSGTGNRTLGSAELIPQVMRARNREMLATTPYRTLIGY
ncbi:hypothetical protein CEP51_006647 [Fusarium floridanum]|uniref:Uncharacterized protein n=1 Tax=Fusarium floridanum TaxID=1325733 RepID=A0A428RS02_9HYPO|nr:hypothetical protein CEP51_006647 [Fusarium floridanum]